ncbi:SMI1/KNR4 family protein [Priestia megaterium]|uniref:SMI1/KNR4 family protein n=1 Tax=Priestia megaterium TaxID=1404 RepID=UPI0018CE3CD8|nr:SMI1/KNR4 family protein [Priestia megaterium]MBG9472903.1 hypothetical protein [Priestia megaterium]
MIKPDIEKIYKILKELPGTSVKVEFEDEVGETLSTPYYIYLKSEFLDGQLGYREDLEANPLIGNQEGDWQESWFVIGYDEEIGGDPLFIDIANVDYPVFTAEHGMGEWDALEMYDSLKEFVEDVT